MLTTRAKGAAVPEETSNRRRRARSLRLLASLEPGEMHPVALYFTYAFTLVVSYYLLKSLREPLLLAAGSAEIKSYAYALTAAALLLLFPLYRFLYRRMSTTRLIRSITVFFLLNLLVFFSLGRAGVDVGFVYYVWVGVAGVTLIAQFWAHAADSFGVASGQRLFPVILCGATLGGLAGPLLFRALYSTLGPWPLMLVAACLLAATWPLVAWSRQSLPASSRSVDPQCGTSGSACPALGGFAFLLRDRYLLLLAALVVLLNCINTTGEYLLTELVLRHADERIAADPTLERGAIVAAFYADFFFAVNALTVATQVLLVGKIFRWIGVHGAVLVLPIVAFIGYALAAFVPIFAILRIVKVLENSTDYSIMNTTRHALYLPLSSAAKYEGKTLIDTFFWRFGDVLQAGVVFVGLHWLGFGFQQFALLNMGLAFIWLVIAAQVARRYRQRTSPQATEHLASGFDGRLASARIIAISKHSLAVCRRGFTSMATVMIAVLGLGASAPANAAVDTATAHVFDDDTPLEMDFFVDMKSLCRNPEHRGCGNEPIVISYVDASGHTRRIQGSTRVRGRWRRETGNCRFPSLFVFFDSETRNTLFDGQTMLPLTTHCRHERRIYERYVLKEYLAYRLYNLLTDKSLRVRLAHITYHDTSGDREPFTRYGFFTEHFETMAARNNATVWSPEVYDPRLADPNELAIHDLFQYMIGNTDFSVIYQHNIAIIRDPDGLATPVPYDFDFSGLVDAHYAAPSPILPIRSVKQRLFRGFCDDRVHWNAVLAVYGDRAGEILALNSSVEAYLASIDELEVHPQTREFISSVMAELAAPIDTCRRLDTSQGNLR